MSEYPLKTSESSITPASSTRSQSSLCKSVNERRSATDLNNYIKVGVRVRPINSIEKRYVIHNTIKFRGDDFVVQCPRSTWTMHGQEHIFQYDHMFWSCDNTYEFSSQEDVYKAMGKPMVDNLFKGYNGSLFVYGQVGSGKTYTMIGKNVDDIDDIEHSGILPRLSRELFQKLSLYTSSKYKVEVSNYEIYKEKIYDLLGPQDERKALRVREHPYKGPYVENLTVKHVINYEELRDYIIAGYRNRLCHPNQLYDKSSKSHSIFCINLSLELINGTFRMGRVWLVDLAGSERLVNGVAEEHLVSTNRSLFTLGKVISALGQRKRGNTFVSYRDSVLTWLLRQCLGGNSLTSMIATITPASSKVMETLATLRYVKQARLIVNPATVNDNVEEHYEMSAKASRSSTGSSSEKRSRPRTALGYTIRFHLSLGIRGKYLPGAGGDIIEDLSRKRAMLFADSVPIPLGSINGEDLLGDEVLLDYKTANECYIAKANFEFADNKDYKMLTPSDIMSGFTSMYDVITSLRSKIGPDDTYLKESYKECKNAMHKFERILWKHLAVNAENLRTEEEAPETDVNNNDNNTND